MTTAERPDPAIFHTTPYGHIYLGDSLDILAQKVEEHSVDLIMTSPPFGLVRKKRYGNADADEYLEWFRPFAEAFKRVLKDNGSLVIDIGGAWVPGQPTRSLYHFKLLIMLCEEFGFHLAQEFYWWNPSKLPTPAEWVTVRRIRVKDAINWSGGYRCLPGRARPTGAFCSHTAIVCKNCSKMATMPENALLDMISAKSLPSIMARPFLLILLLWQTRKATVFICAIAEIVVLSHILHVIRQSCLNILLEC